MKTYKKMGRFHNLMDNALAQGLGVDVKIYIEVIDKKMH